MCIFKTATRIESGVAINVGVTVLQLIMDAVKSEPNSDSEMYSDSKDGSVVVKEEEVPPMTFLQVKTENEVSFASYCYFLSSCVKH
jgi:hypothetical protein